MAGRQSTVRVPVPALVFKLSRDVHTADTLALAKQLADVLESPLQLISFLSRRHVNWLSLTLASRYQDGNSAQFRELKWLRGGIMPDHRAKVELIANPYRMKATGIASLIANFANSQYRDVLFTAMEYLPSASQARYVEAKLLFGFTALETLVNGIHKADASDKNLATGDFDRLARQLRGAIEQYRSATSLSAEVAGNIAAKLPELNRPPVAGQIEALIHPFAVPYDDL